MLYFQKNMSYLKKILTYNMTYKEMTIYVIFSKQLILICHIFKEILTYNMMI